MITAPTTAPVVATPATTAPLAYGAFLAVYVVCGAVTWTAYARRER
ncbi:hypothetical protein [Streptomyces sp. NPDC088923]